MYNGQCYIKPLFAMGNWSGGEMDLHCQSTATTTMDLLCLTVVGKHAVYVISKCAFLLGFHLEILF